MKIIIVPREDNDGGEVDFAHQLLWYLHRDGGRDVAVKRLSDFVKLSMIDVDLVISVGGDGTFLRVVSGMNIQRPILGVNFGTVGFLTDIEKDDAIETISELITSHLNVEKRMRIDVLCEGKLIGTSLNEISFRSNTKSMAGFSIIIDGVVASQFKGDGLVISTATGSTAYAMSAGGPITDPCIQGFVIVPVAPYLLSSRPMIVHESRTILIKANYGIMYIDGSMYSQSPKEITLRISYKPALIVDAGRNFFEKVNTKLKNR
jgi:NAD+ kinase